MTKRSAVHSAPARVYHRENRIARSKGERIGQLIIVFVLALIALCTLYPFWRVIMFSISDGRQSLMGGLFLVPKGFSLYGYYVTLNNPLIWLSYRNTIMVTVFGTSLSVLLSAMTAYPLSVRRLHGRRLLSLVMYFTMLFGGGMIPTYLLVKSLGMIDTFWVLIIPGCLAAYNVFVLRNFMNSIPGELSESARIDGAGDYTILFKIILPLSMPSLAAIAMFYGVGNWNSYMESLIYTSGTHLYTLQLYLRNLLQTANATSDMLTMAGENANVDYLNDNQMQAVVIVVALVPVLIVYPWLQRFYTKGIVVGAVKG